MIETTCLLIYFCSILLSWHLLYKASLAEFGCITVAGCIALFVLAIFPVVGLLSATAIWALSDADKGIFAKIVFEEK